MDKQRKLEDTIGNGSTKSPILVSAEDPMAAQSKPSQPLTSIGEGSTKPVTIAEALSLLQTLTLDMRSLNCRAAILARKGRIYFVIEPPASIGEVGVNLGHVTINNKPVVTL